MNINDVGSIVERDGIIFLTYCGFLSQTLISAMTESLEREAEYENLNMSVATNIYSVFIELSQNMLNYAKSKSNNSSKSEGLIVVGRNKIGDNNFYIKSQNIIDENDVEKLTVKLTEIAQMNKDELRKRYKELRKSGANTHAKGGGIGFLEIAKRCDSIEFEIKKLNEFKSIFEFTANILSKKD